MKVKKLVIDYEYDFQLYGLSTSMKDYKLAWSINKQLNLSLVRAEDYMLDSRDDQSMVVNYDHTTEHVELRLFKNKAVTKEGIPQQYMVPEHKHYDYFVIVKGIIHTFADSELLNQFRSIIHVQLVNEIEIDTLKSKEHFLY